MTMGLKMVMIFVMSVNKMSEMKNLIKRLYVYYFSDNPNENVINSIMLI